MKSRGFCYLDHTTGESDHMYAHIQTDECVKRKVTPTQPDAAPRDCENCDGTGKVHSHNDECWECEGSGIAGEAARRRAVRKTVRVATGRGRR